MTEIAFLVIRAFLTFSQIREGFIVDEDEEEEEDGVDPEERRQRRKRKRRQEREEEAQLDEEDLDLIGENIDGWEGKQTEKVRPDKNGANILY
jgi:hypothetical protein